MDKIKEFFGTHREAIAAVIVTMILAAGIVFTWHKFEEHSAPAITPVQNTKPQTLQQYFPLSGSEAKDVSHQIDKAQAAAPVFHFYTTDDKAADQQIQQRAKADKSDYVFKTQENVTPAGSQTAVYDNKYFAVTTERKHAIGIGAAVIDNKPTASVSYRNRRTTYSVYYNSAQTVGAGVSYEFARW